MSLNEDDEEEHGASVFDGPPGYFKTEPLADLPFNHSEHGKLVRTVQMTLKRSKGARALVWFTPYRPWLLERDMKFFELMKESNRIGEEDRVAEDGMKELMEKVMFEEDPGDETLRRTVFGFELLWTDLQDQSAQGERFTENLHLPSWCTSLLTGF